MLPHTMATSKTTKPARVRGTASKAGGRPEGKRASKYAMTGEEGRREAQRRLLSETLQEHGWNLTATAEALGMAGSPAVIRAIRDVGLQKEYEQAKKDGLISPANRRS